MSHLNGGEDCEFESHPRHVIFFFFFKTFIGPEHFFFFLVYGAIVLILSPQIVVSAKPMKIQLANSYKIKLSLPDM